MPKPDQELPSFVEQSEFCVLLRRGSSRSGGWPLGIFRPCLSGSPHIVQCSRFAGAAAEKGSFEQLGIEPGRFLARRCPLSENRFERIDGVGRQRIGMRNNVPPSNRSIGAGAWRFPSRAKMWNPHFIIIGWL